MNHQRYSNFVPPLHTEISTTLTGEEAKKLYLEEIIENTEGRDYSIGYHDKTNSIISRDKKIAQIDISNCKLFHTVQSNDVYRLRRILDACPDKINSIDEFGWSLLMIACQANSVDTVKELLHRGIDVTIRDKAGNSAQSLVIRNNNYLLADIFLDHLKSGTINKTIKTELKSNKKIKEKYACTVCDGKLFDNKKEHLSSTVHNLNTSKVRKFPANYVIPESNKGYQIMLKVGWDKESGLGPNGSGKKYPIKTVQKLDKKGLGHEKIKKTEFASDKRSLKIVNRKVLESEYEKNRRMEINFRREFY